MRAVLFHRPTTIFSLLAIAGLLVTASFALVAGYRPSPSVTVRQGPGDSVIIDGVGALPGEAVARFLGRGGQVLFELPVRELVSGLEPRGTPAENRAHYEALDRIADLFGRGGTLQLPDGRDLGVYAIQSPGFRLSHDGWGAIGVGFVALLTGLWVVVLRPREFAAQMFALSGASLWMASITIVLTNTGGLTTAGWAVRSQLQANHISGMLFGGALVAIFCRYPLPLVPTSCAVLWSLALLALGIAGIFDPWPDFYGTSLIALVLSVGMMFALVFAQAWASRKDPVRRGAVAWVGTALLLSTGIFTAVNFLPQLMRAPLYVGDSVAMSAFLLFYFALAVAITRYRMFDLGNWTLYVVRAVVVVLLVLIADMALVYWAGERWTLSVGALLVAVFWLPVRSRLMRLADRRRDADTMRLIRGANEVAFAMRPQDQAALWRKVLKAQFDPLEVFSTTTQKPEIREDGRILAIPSPLGSEGLALSFAGQGSRLFDSNDLNMADALYQLVEEMIRARKAYDEGVRTERLRIARDLHDDVGARLLTGMHMADQQLRPTLQAAMSDIRAIVSGMTGEQVSLERLLSDVRHETARRLEAAGIALDWPLAAYGEGDIPVDYRQQKAITSACREAVSNALRHAHASMVRVGVVIDAGRLGMVIADDGRGMPEAALTGETQGYGLRNLRRRMEDVGGRIDIESGPGGTNIRLSLPLTVPTPFTPSEQGVTDLSGSVPLRQ